MRDANESEPEFDEDLEDERGFAESVNVAIMSEENSRADEGNLTLAQALSVFKDKDVADSIMKEITNMREHGVMEYIKTEEFRKINPQGKSLIPSKIFLKGKHDAHGRFTKLKSRLVAEGHR